MRATSSLKQLTTYVDADRAERFKAWARQTYGTTAAALSRLISEAIDGKASPTSSGIGRGKQIGVRFKDNELHALTAAAAARGTTPANWLRSLAIVHLVGRPQWNLAEVDILRELSRQLGAIGNNVNQMAYAMNLAVHSGDYPPNQGTAAREAAESIRFELRRVAAVVSGNFGYWGLPTAEQPTAAPGAVEYADALARIAEADRRSRPRRRPRRFLET